MVPTCPPPHGSGRRSAGATLHRETPDLCNNNDHVSGCKGRPGARSRAGGGETLGPGLLIGGQHDDGASGPDDPGRLFEQPDLADQVQPVDAPDQHDTGRAGGRASPAVGRSRRPPRCPTSPRRPGPTEPSNPMPTHPSAPPRRPGALADATAVTRVPSPDSPTTTGRCGIGPGQPPDEMLRPLPRVRQRPAATRPTPYPAGRPGPRTARPEPRESEGHRGGHEPLAVDRLDRALAARASAARMSASTPATSPTKRWPIWAERPRSHRSSGRPFDGAPHPGQSMSGCSIGAWHRRIPSAGCPAGSDGRRRPAAPVRRPRDPGRFLRGRRPGPRARTSGPHPSRTYSGRPPGAAGGGSGPACDDPGRRPGEEPR